MNCTRFLLYQIFYLFWDLTTLIIENYCRTETKYTSMRTGKYLKKYLCKMYKIMESYEISLFEIDLSNPSNLKENFVVHNRGK